MTPEDPPWLMAVDGTGLYVRCAKAAARTGMTAPDGTPTGALTLFASSFAALAREVSPQYLVITWDGPDGTAWRKGICPEYKANRTPVSYWRDQDIRAFEAVREFCDAARITQWCLDDFEGDDLLAAACRLAARDLPGTRVVVASDDADVLQLAEEGRVWIRWLGRDGAMSDAETIELLHGVAPRDLAKLRALAGDPSDGIPGIRGLGPVRGASMLNAFRGRWPLPPDVMSEEGSGRVRDWYRVMNLIDPEKTPESCDETGSLVISETLWERGDIIPVLEKYGMRRMVDRARQGRFW